MAQRKINPFDQRKKFNLQLATCDFKNDIIIALPAASNIPYGLQKYRFPTSDTIKIVNKRTDIDKLDKSVNNVQHSGTYLHGPRGFGKTN